MTDTHEEPTRGLRRDLVARLLRPRAVAVVGVSSRPGSAGQISASLLDRDGFTGQVYLVGRGGGSVGDRPILGSVDDLPDGVDLALLTLPASGVPDAIEAAIRRGVGAAVLFASGFAETGEEARQVQASLTERAEAAGLGILGPNCIGFANYVTGFEGGFLPGGPCVAISADKLPGVAILGQSGGIVGHVWQGLEARHVSTAYRISTGNEAGLGISDFLSYMADDPAVSAAVVYAEHVRYPAAFLTAVAQMRAAGKSVIFLHSGRGERAKVATASHTGALAGDYQVMTTAVRRAGALVVETLEELVDCTEYMVRYPEPPVGELAILTTSGALCAMAHDYCEDLGIELAPLPAALEAELTPRLPEFTPPKNPLDLTTQVVWDQMLTVDATKAMLADDVYGSATIIVPPNGDWVGPLADFAKESRKPVLLAPLGDGTTWLPGFQEVADQGKLMIMRSAERALRTTVRATQYGRGLQRKSTRDAGGLKVTLPGTGTLAEWRGKEILTSIGVQIPEGGLARSPDEAAAIAQKIGYPVVMKVQAPELAHKTEVGGVLLNLADDAAVRAAYATLEQRAAKARPDVTLDGVLVEKMSGKGLELLIGAKRDPSWGPVVMVALGGIFVEALHDVRMLAPDLTEADIVEELFKLKSAKLLGPFRGDPARDVAAVASLAAKVGQLMMANEEILEIDINPLIVMAEGQGAVALDALFVCQ